MNKDSRIYVAGHTGMVGSAIVRRLEAGGYKNVRVTSRDSYDHRDGEHAMDAVDERRPEYVFLAAATVGGIAANITNPVAFLEDNLQIELNVIRACWKYRVKRLCYLGSSCIYPRNCPQPITEERLLTGPLEPTNQWYAIAKIAGLKLCEAYNRQHGFDYVAPMPTNLYGPNDNFDLETSHVVPALIRKFHEAKATNASSVAVWGSGRPRREFLHVDDCADACVFLMETEASGRVNVGCGFDMTISDLAGFVAKAVGYTGTIKYDFSKPDGTPRKLLNVGVMRSLGWTPNIPLLEGLERTYKWYLEHEHQIAQS